MTSQRSFKRLVRARMDKTGEGYAAARAALLGRDAATAAAETPFTISDDAIERRTDRGWEAWFDLLDASPVAGADHASIARWVGKTQDVDSWSAQAITVSYERTRGGRAVGERPNGFQISVSKTVGVPVERLFDGTVEPAGMAAWLPDGGLRTRTTLRPKSARFDWQAGASRVLLSFVAKGDARATITVTHERLADADAAAEMKAFWRSRLADLTTNLEG